MDDHNLNIYDFHARGYDQAIGRTWQHDPNSFNYPAWSPYSWTGNNPILNIDPDGKDWYRFLDDNGNESVLWRQGDASSIDIDGLTYSNIGFKYSLSLADGAVMNFEQQEVIFNDQSASKSDFFAIEGQSSQTARRNLDAWTKLFKENPNDENIYRMYIKVSLSLYNDDPIPSPLKIIKENLKWPEGGAFSGPGYDMNRSDHVQDLANMHEFIMDYSKDPGKYRKAAENYIMKFYGKYLEENKKNKK